MEVLTELMTNMGDAGKYTEYGVVGLLIVSAVGWLKNQTWFGEWDAKLPSLPLAMVAAKLLCVAYAWFLMPGVEDTPDAKIAAGLIMAGVIMGGRAAGKGIKSKREWQTVPKKKGKK